MSRCVLVELLFSLVWVPGKRLISLLGLELKSLGTTELKPDFADTVPKVNKRVASQKQNMLMETCFNFLVVD